MVIDALVGFTVTRGSKSLRVASFPRKLRFFSPTKIELVLLYSVLKRRKVKLEKNVTNVNLNANWDQAYNVFLFSPLYNNFFYQEYGM